MLRWALSWRTCESELIEVFSRCSENSYRMKMPTWNVALTCIYSHALQRLHFLSKHSIQFMNLCRQWMFVQWLSSSNKKRTPDNAHRLLSVKLIHWLHLVKQTNSHIFHGVSVDRSTSSTSTSPQGLFWHTQYGFRGHRYLRLKFNNWYRKASFQSFMTRQTKSSNKKESLGWFLCATMIRFSHTIQVFI